jgi:hypothetical protein
MATLINDVEGSTSHNTSANQPTRNAQMAIASPNRCILLCNQNKRFNVD